MFDGKSAPKAQLRRKKEELKNRERGRAGTHAEGAGEIKEVRRRKEEIAECGFRRDCRNNTLYEAISRYSSDDSHNLELGLG
jgi:hypothetical protein